MIKMPKLPKLTKRLQVTARTLSETGSPDFAPAQPTARLGSAFILAFSCHVFLVLGMFSFHKIRAGRAPSEKVDVAKVDKTQSEKPLEKSSVQGGADVAKAGGGEAVASAARAVLAAGVGGAAAAAQGTSQPASGPAKTAAMPSGAAPVAAKNEGSPKVETGDLKASSKTYVVKTGDNPVRIAKSLGVKLEDLQALNGIDDPKKLKVGQTLKVPETAKTERPSGTQTKTTGATKSVKPSNTSNKSASGVSPSAKSSLAASKSGTKATSGGNKK